MRWPLVVLLLLASLAPRAEACEFDGLSHGYGPASAMFAGAHRYQALNGLADEAEARAGVAPLPDATTKARPPTPPRSFAGWAVRKTRAAAADEAPARWGATPVAAPSAQAPAGSPQQAQPQQRERAQRPPSGGPVP